MKIEEEVDAANTSAGSSPTPPSPAGRVPAYLLIPKAVLEENDARRPPSCACTTDNVIGHGVVVGLGGKPNRQYASELAERGYVVARPNYPLLAKYQPDLKALGWESGTLKAVWDNIAGLDLLESLPFVNKDKGFGAIGHSLGGHNSVYTAVVRRPHQGRRVQLRAGLVPRLLQRRREIWQPEKGWCQTRYMPRLADYRGRLAEIPFDFHEMIGALAPRHVLIIAPTKDSNFHADSVDRIAAAAGQVFKLYGHADRLRVEHPDCEHDFPDEMRQEAYRLIDRVLR